MAKISVLGAGSWGTALSVLLNNNGHEVRLWSRFQEEVDTLKQTRELTSKLPGVHIPENIDLTADVKNCVETAEVIALAVPSPYVRGTAELMAPYVKDEQIIVNVAKGIEDKTFDTMTEIMEEELPTCEAVVLSGPSHAEEVGRNIPTVVVIGAKKKEVAQKVQIMFANKYFRTYISPDRKSIELGGSLKNVIALAAGIIDGLGFGDNTEAALITRGIKEITALGVKMGGHSRTFNGLSGIGDLIVTCNSKHSRNRRAGVLIGKGYTLDEAVKEVKMVVEGAVSAKAALELAKKYNVDMPIVEAVNEVLFDNKPAEEAMWELMEREQTNEFHDLEWR